MTAHQILHITGLFLCLSYLPVAVANAQNASDLSETRVISAEQWEKAASGLDYSKDLPKPPKAPRTPRPSGSDWTADTEALGKLLQVLAIMAAVGLIGYALYRIMQEPHNKRVARDGVTITLENLEEYLHETDLDVFLREALAQGDYAQAIRLHYLGVIKDLSNKSLIEWAREKTNLNYLREMRGHPLHPAFKRATQTYERVWYGNTPVNKDQYAQLETLFRFVG